MAQRKKRHRKHCQRGGFFRGTNQQRGKGRKYDYRRYRKKWNYKEQHGGSAYTPFPNLRKERLLRQRFGRKIVKPPGGGVIADRIYHP